MAICKSLRVCGILPRTTYKKGGGFGVGAPTAALCVQLKEAQMHYVEHIMPCAWWQDVAVHFGTSCVIMGLLQTPYKATAPDAGNVRGSLSKYLNRRHEE